MQLQFETVGTPAQVMLHLLVGEGERLWLVVKREDLRAHGKGKCILSSLDNSLKRSLKHLCAECATPATAVCAQCGVFKYCSKVCQKKAWRSHKQICIPNMARAASFYS